MFVDPREIAAAEERFGHPRVLHVSQKIGAIEEALVRASQRDGRAHDVTLFIGRQDGAVVLIRKHMFPEGAWRAPSGGLRPGEPLEIGALREAREETGLAVALVRYLVRAHAVFETDGGPPIAWTSHVFLARWEQGEIAPQDTDEIEAARWALPQELLGPVREVLLATGLGLFAYRVRLHDEAAAAVGGDFRPPAGR